MAKKQSQRSHISHRLLRVFKSRQMVIAVSTLVVGLLVVAVPDLKPIREELLTLIITLALAAIGSYTVHETASAERQPYIPREELRELVEDVLSDMVEEAIPSERNIEETTQHSEKHESPP
jgi:hypothetical protein